MTSNQDICSKKKRSLIWHHLNSFSACQIGTNLDALIAVTEVDIGHSSIYGNWQGSLMDWGFSVGIFGQVSDLRATENSADNKDATSMLGMRFVACGSPADTRPWPPAVQLKHSRTCQDYTGMPHDVSRTPRMGLQTLRTVCWLC